MEQALLWAAERAEIEAHDELKVVRKMFHAGLASQAAVTAAENKASEACQTVLQHMRTLKPWLSPARQLIAA